VSGLARGPRPAHARLTCEAIFGLSFDQLVAMASRRGMRFETKSATFKVTLDTVAGTSSRALAVLVEFEPETRSTPPAQAAPRTPELDAILGIDAEVLAAKALAAKVGATRLPILLLAETGTGKELFARAIHAASGRGPFVAVNCGALPEGLVASELFGYCPGAFTGASRTGSEGRIAAAAGGTLFLDEIAEMPLSLQAALLRVLEGGVYQRVGEARDRRADFRLVCATSRDLPTLVEAGTFRRDLFYRIKGACLTIPALRDRTDLLWLADRLLEGISERSVPALSPEARRVLEAQSWPGNVRELKSALAYGVALAEGEPCIRPEHLPQPLAPASALAARAPRTAGEGATKKRIVHDAIESTLRACAGNVSEAARRLGVGRGTIYRNVRENKAR
jgi:transcriptional regulator with PAS, ATPase and Fis domain